MITDQEYSNNFYVNEAITKCLKYLDGNDRQKFIKKFKAHRGDEKQIFDTHRELIVGARLHTMGFKVEYEKKIDSQTPDWSINSKLKLTAIIEVASYHPDYITEKRLDEAIQNGKGLWVPSKPNRLYECIWEKITKYKRLIAKYQLSFVVAVYREFGAEFEPKQIQISLYDKNEGLFNNYPELSGVILFRESLPDTDDFPLGYHFDYLENPKADITFDFQS